MKDRSGAYELSQISLVIVNFDRTLSKSVSEPKDKIHVDQLISLVVHEPQGTTIILIWTWIILVENKAIIVFFGKHMIYKILV